MIGPVQSEKRLLWHPRHDNKFVVGGGSQITLYEWAPDYPEIRHVTSQHDLQFMKCFAWSPDPAFEDLIAVGLSTGRVDLFRLEASKYSRRNSVLSSGPSVILPVRNSRSCNALAFCIADPNYLAVGLDKVRGDCSLVIWDINSASPALSMTPPLPSSTINGGPTMSLRPQPRIPRADIGPRTDPRVLQQHAPTEIVSSLSFLPQSTNLLLAGISHRWLRLFDLRSSVPSTTNVASKVHGIATDPFDQHRIACFGDGIVSVWDSRKLPHPVMTFTEKDASADGARVRTNSVYTAIEFSSTRRGTLAALEKDATYVRFWDLLQAQAHTSELSSGGQSRDSSLSSRATRRSWANLPWTAGSSENQTQPSSKTSESHASLVLSDTRRTKDFSRPLASFALVPSPQTHSLTSNVMVVNREGDLELYAVHDTPKQVLWSARGDLAIGAGQSYRILVGFHEDELPPEPWDVRHQHEHQHSNIETSSNSHFGPSREESAVRGRGRGKANNTVPAPTLFGRGDEDGFPALTQTLNVTQPPTYLAATRPGKGGAYTPTSLRNYRDHGEYSGASGVDAGDRPCSRTRPGTDRLAGEASRGRSRVPDRDKTLSRSRKQLPKGISHVVEDDISMIMRRRTIRGYGLGRPQHNVLVTQDEHDPPDETTSDLWAWIHHSKELLSVPTPRLHGYDFSYEGLLGIWEGFQALPHQKRETTPVTAHRDLLEPDSSTAHHEKQSSRRSRSPNDRRGNFHASLVILAARRGADGSTWKPTVVTAKLVQRQVALRLCGWSLREEDLLNVIKGWEKDGKYSRAACWLVFTQQYSKAVELLMRSEDESHHMMSGTLAALNPHGSGISTKSFELRDHCERLIVRLQDPYFRAMLTHLTLGDWSEVLEEEALPFRERLAIAFQFLDDRALSSYLRRTTDRSIARGDIDGIIVSGLTKPGIDILQSYVDHTGDIQTAAILASYVCPSKFPDSRAERWVEAYRDLLDGFKLFHYRVSFDIERGQILHDAMQNGGTPQIEWAPRQILIRCNYCNKTISVRSSAVTQKGRATACPNCNRPLPRCSICLMTLGIVQDAAREAELAHVHFKDTIDDAIVICQTCRHGGHASHILEWFFGEDGIRTHGTCAVADCNCRCADEF